MFCTGTVGAAKHGSLSIKFVHEGTVVPCAAFNLYKVADRAANGTYTPTKNFEDYSVSFIMTRET